MRTNVGAILSILNSPPITKNKRKSARQRATCPGAALGRERAWKAVMIESKSMHSHCHLHNNDYTTNTGDNVRGNCAPWLRNLKSEYWVVAGIGLDTGFGTARPGNTLVDDSAKTRTLHTIFANALQRNAGRSKVEEFGAPEGNMQDGIGAWRWKVGTAWKPLFELSSGGARSCSRHASGIQELWRGMLSRTSDVENCGR